VTVLQLHLISVSFWFGLVSAEVVLELSARDEPSRRFVAKVHKWIDILFEIPVVILVIASGALLLSQVWPGSSLLLIKVVLGMVAITANFMCFQFVHSRAGAKDDARIQAMTRRVLMTGLAFPIGIAAFVIGIGFLN